MTRRDQVNRQRLTGFPSPVKKNPGRYDVRGWHSPPDGKKDHRCKKKLEGAWQTCLALNCAGADAKVRHVNCSRHWPALFTTLTVTGLLGISFGSKEKQKKNFRGKQTAGKILCKPQICYFQIILNSMEKIINRWKNFAVVKLATWRFANWKAVV